MKIKLRVLVVGPLPPPVGGVETVTQAILESESFKRFSVSHCDLTKGRPKETQGRFDIGNARWAIVHFGRMVRSMRAYRPQIVYMPMSTTWSGFWRDAVLAWIGRFFGARVVGHIHGPKIVDVLAKRGIVGHVVRSCINQFDVLAVLGAAWKDFLLGYGYRGRVEVVPSTLSKEFFVRANAFDRDYSGDGSNGLFVGQMGKRKGVFDLLEALHRLKEAGRPAKVVFVGPAEYQGEWDALMRRRGELAVEDVAEFTGPLHGEALGKRFQEASYFVLPSYREGLPVVLFEAAVYGLPVVATPVGVSADLLKHDENCLLVEPGDVDGIATAIDRLRSSPQDRKRIARQLRKDVNRYHPDVVCSEIGDILLSMSESYRPVET